MIMPRRPSRAITLGTVRIGGMAPIVVQSMTTTPTRHAAATATQIRALAAAGCEVVRVALPDQAAIAALAPILKSSPVPLVADIHYDHRLALAAIDAGIHGLRINPGTIGSHAKLRAVARAAEAAAVPIRVGVNSGSLAKHARGLEPARALVESALVELRVLEELGFEAIKVSLKASAVDVLVEANRELARLRPYPLHLGLTEAGTARAGAIRSSAALAILLSEGIGDTIRVSLAADPIEEVLVAWELLRALGLRGGGVRVIACPTCARAHGPVIALAEKIEAKLARRSCPRGLCIAVMGCEVNGPGEAAHADIGIAFGRSQSLLFRAGEIAHRGQHDEIETLLLDSIEEFLDETKE